MKRFAPFLKLYTEYVKNFETAMSTINIWLERSVKFKRTIQEIQVCWCLYYSNCYPTAIVMLYVFLTGHGQQFFMMCTR